MLEGAGGSWNGRSPLFYSYNRVLNDLKKPDLLILDDFGMAPLDPGACRDLLEVVDDRHGKKSLAISAQLPVANWYSVFEDATIADAALDRLVNNAHRQTCRKRHHYE
jgi:DNA replication protein DnaC